MLPPTKQAFSLVELSIVLVILGLLVGGILSGQALIRAAELRAVNTEYSRYVTALQTFRDKYFAIPGDMANAITFWGAASGGCPTGARTGTQTCNGNGDVIVHEAQQEHFLFWQHLANAGLLEGSFSGRSGPADTYYDVVAGTNAPASKLSRGIWTVRTFTAPQTGNPNWFDGTYGNHFGLGAKQVWNDSVLLKPEELWNMDTKFDDGRPGIGKVVAYNWSTCTTATASSQTTTAAYALTTNSVQCVGIFPNAF
jgi:prepilin-type N-terminal cleavage/methylation domain-containing protein